MVEFSTETVWSCVSLLVGFGLLIRYLYLGCFRFFIYLWFCSVRLYVLQVYSYLLDYSVCWHISSTTVSYDPFYSCGINVDIPHYWKWSMEMSYYYCVTICLSLVLFWCLKYPGALLLGVHIFIIVIYFLWINPLIIWCVVSYYSF